VAFGGVKGRESSSHDQCRPLAPRGRSADAALSAEEAAPALSGLITYHQTSLFPSSSSSRVSLPFLAFITIGPFRLTETYFVQTAHFSSYITAHWRLARSAVQVLTRYPEPLTEQHLGVQIENSSVCSIVTDVREGDTVHEISIFILLCTFLHRPLRGSGPLYLLFSRRQLDCFM